MYASAELLTRRDHLVQHATQTILPLKTWWEQYGNALQYYTPSSYFNGRIYSLVQESEEEIERIARQHPRYITEKKLDDFQQRFQTLPESWLWLLREARLFETLRPKVNTTSLDPQDILGQIHHCIHEITWASRDVKESKPYGGRIPELDLLIDELSYLADLAKKVQKSVEHVGEQYRLTYWRDPARPPIAPDHRFKMEHDLLYLKFLEAHTKQLSEQFLAVHTPVGTLTTRISEALIEWRGILNLLHDSPLVAFAWQCHQDLVARVEGWEITPEDLQSAYETTHIAVQEAFQSQFARRLP